MEVTARLEGLLRRTRQHGGRHNPADQAKLLRCGDLSVDEERHLIRRGDRIIELSPTEYRLLTYLMVHQGRVLTKVQILQHPWKYDAQGDGTAVERFVSNLHRKIDSSDAPLIHTVRGFGYSMHADSSP
jgi:two-component system, OmpR family, response regulator